MEIKLTLEELSQKKLFIATPMYGGMCSGMYAKSMCDLSAICTKYNIALQFFALFNESLITRARNYCCDEFLRSQMDYFLFLDADIGFDPSDVIAMMAIMTPDSPYDVLGAPYPKKSLTSAAKIETEDGIKTIKWIVDNKYVGKVKTINENGGFGWNNVVEHYVTPSEDSNKKWVKLGRYGRKNLTLTDDHEVYVLNDPFSFDIKIVPAKNSEGTYILRNPVLNGKNSINSLYGKDQISFLIGTLIGDGCVNNKGYLKFGHSDSQIEYLKLKQKLFGGKLSEIKKISKYKNKEYFGQFLECPRNAQNSKLREIIYPNGKKTIKDIIHLLDEKGLAFWYLDDGSLRDYNTNPYALFCTDSFTYEEHEILQNYMKNKWNIDTFIAKNGNKFRLHVKTSDTNKLFDIISPYVIQSMEYKIPLEFRGGVKYNFDLCENRDYAVELIKEVKYVTDGIPHKQYDIGVETNHNFVADNYVVRNCISWEKIVQAVNKGMADEDPQVLDKYVGDFVFNPKGNQREMPLGEPCEVLELGTGFMMMRRNTLTKFQEAFPQYMYRPDHIRTAQFDGSREIMQFFQAEIDQYYPENDYKDIFEEIKNSDNIDNVKLLVDKMTKKIEDKKGKSSKRYLSEDYWFSQKCQEIGLKAWLCPWMKTTHMGSMIYGGSLIDLAQIGASPTADSSLLKKKR